LRRNRNRRDRLWRRNPRLHGQRLRHLLLLHPRRLPLVRLPLRQPELQRGQPLLARQLVRRLPLIQQRKQHLLRPNPELRLPAQRQQLVQCGLVWHPRLALQLLRLRDLQRLAALLDTLAHRQLIARPQRLGPIGLPAQRPRVNDIQQVLALLREQAKAARRRDFDPQLRGKPALEALRDPPHVSHNAQVAVVEDVRAKAPSEPKDPAQAFRKPSQASLYTRASLLHRADVRSSRSVTRKGSANSIPYDLAQEQARVVRRRSSQLRQFKENRAQLP
jgi:hypothetical protein